MLEFQKKYILKFSSVLRFCALLSLASWKQKSLSIQEFRKFFEKLRHLSKEEGTDVSIPVCFVRRRKKKRNPGILSS